MYYRKLIKEQSQQIFIILPNIVAKTQIKPYFCKILRFYEKAKTVWLHCCQIYTIFQTFNPSESGLVFIFKVVYITKHKIGIDLKKKVVALI